MHVVIAPLRVHKLCTNIAAHHTRAPGQEWHRHSSVRRRPETQNSCIPSLTGMASSLYSMRCADQWSNQSNVDTLSRKTDAPISGASLPETYGRRLAVYKLENNTVQRMSALHLKLSPTPKIGGVTRSQQYLMERPDSCASTGTIRGRMVEPAYANLHRSWPPTQRLGVSRGFEMLCRRGCSGAAPDNSPRHSLC